MLRFQPAVYFGTPVGSGVVGPYRESCHSEATPQVPLGGMTNMVPLIWHIPIILVPTTGSYRLRISSQKHPYAMRDDKPCSHR
jgi:hypothetical protein